MLGGVQAEWLLTGAAFVLCTIGAVLALRRLKQEARSERAEGQRLLREARERLGDVFDAAPDPILVVGRQGELAHANVAARSAFGLDIPLIDTEGAANARDGRRFEFTASRLALEGGGYGAILMGRDVTARHRAEELLRRNERLSSLGTLVAGVAHEVNNPLMYIQGHLEMAIAELDSPEPDSATMRESIETALKGARRIEFISKGLRAVVRDTPARDEPVQVNAVVDEVARLLHGALPGNVALVVDLDPADPVIQGDPHELHQVIVNLARNAIEAVCARGGCVWLTTSATAGTAEIRIHDDGPGVPEHVRSRLFTPFYTTKAEGTGLGLAIVHSIVQAHHGDIVLASEPGQGATFRVVLPRALAEPPLVTG